MPDETQRRVLDACLVTLMEHGFTPSALISRITADSVPGEIQVAMAAGLLAVGNVFVGTMEGCASLLEAGVKAADQEAWCAQTAADFLDNRRPLPGFGHPFHKPDDPRAPRLFAVARAADVEGKYIALLQQLGNAVDHHSGRHLSFRAPDVVEVLERVCGEVGYPASIRVDQGSEFISRDLDLWAYTRGVTLDFSRPGKPTDNAFIESFNGKSRAECLNQHWFMSLDDTVRKR